MCGGDVGGGVVGIELDSDYMVTFGVIWIG